MNIDQIRINDIQKQMKGLELREKVLSARLIKSNRIAYITTGIYMAVTSIGTLAGSASLTTLTLPVAFIRIPVTIVYGTSTAINKVITKKSKKQIIELESIRNQLKTSKLALSIALDDNKITDEEPKKY